MDSTRDIGMIILFLIVIFLVINQIKMSKNKEKFALTTDNLTTVRNEINRIYDMDVEAIRNLGAISKSLLTGTNTFTASTTGTPGQLTIPADLTIMEKDLRVNKNMAVNGVLSVNGSQLIPPGIIMAWYQPTAPAGWGLCDGTKYGTIQSPDLRGRFIKMYTPGYNGGDNWYDVTDSRNKDINTTARENGGKAVIRYTDFGVKGGTDIKQLHLNEMPAHTHTFLHTPFVNWHIGNHSTHGNQNWAAQHMDRTDTTSQAGLNWGHGINSPYYTLVYIIYKG